MSMIGIVANRVEAASTADAFGKAIAPILTHIINPIVMFMFALAVVVFVYGILEMLSKGADADARSKGKTHMVSGVVGMFIMISAWGIINIIANTVFQFK